MARVGRSLARGERMSVRLRQLPVGSMLSAQGLLSGAALAFVGEEQGASRRPRTPVPNAVIAEFHSMEEKGSDVNLAAYLLNDAWMNLFDVAVVVSNATDLVVPIRMVNEERQRPVFIVCPGALADRTAVAASRQPCPPRSTRDAEGRATSGLDSRHRHSETRTLVAPGSASPQHRRRRSTCPTSLVSASQSTPAS